MRKVLYSPGFGAGWVTWYSGPKEQKLFMLEYKPFVEYLEKGNKFPDVWRKEDEDSHPLIVQFKKDWDETFPECKEDYPFFGGLKNLRVAEFKDGTVVRLEEYDGSESIHESYDDWL